MVEHPSRSRPGAESSDARPDSRRTCEVRPMVIEILAAITAVAAFLALFAVLHQVTMLHRLRLLAEQSLAGTRSEAETTRAALSREQGQQRQEIGGYFDSV